MDKRVRREVEVILEVGRVTRGAEKGDEGGSSHHEDTQILSTGECILYSTLTCLSMK